ncbi:hypothetical protein B0H12DRAFT_1144393 [Mycena haematopus]|nr:hypothetical protein B0H12DRAFT_1144393 [Mycena haematopus]
MFVSLPSMQTCSLNVIPHYFSTAGASLSHGCLIPCVLRRKVQQTESRLARALDLVELLRVTPSFMQCTHRFPFSPTLRDAVSDVGGG